MPAVHAFKNVAQSSTASGGVTLRTVGVGKTLAANFVLQNKTPTALAVTLFVTGIAEATETMYAPGAATGPAYLTLPAKIARVVGTGNTSQAVSHDYRSYSLDGGLTWSTPEADTYYGFTTDVLQNPFKIKVTGATTVELRPSALGVHGAYHVNAITVTGLDTTLIPLYPQAFLENVVIDGVNASSLVAMVWPTSTAVCTKYYTSVNWDTDSARTTTGAAATSITSPFHYFVGLDGTNNYITLTLLQSTLIRTYAALAVSDSWSSQNNPGFSLGSDSIAEYRVAYGGTRVFFLTNTDKCFFIQNRYNFNVDPSFSTPTSLPGSLKRTEIRQVFGLNKWVIEETSGALRYSNTTSDTSTWTLRAALTPASVEGLDGCVYRYVTSLTTIETLLPGMGNTYLNSTWSIPANTLVRNNLGYAVGSSIANTLPLESYELPAGATVNLSGRLFAASAAIKATSRDSSGQNLGVSVSLFGLES